MTTATDNGNRISTEVKTTSDETRALSPFASEGNFVAAQRVAKALCKASLVPDSFKGENNLPNVLIALELAARIGASPMMVMQNLYVVHGKPSWSASFLIACVNQSARFTPLRFIFEGRPGTKEWGCRAVAKDKETGETCTGSLITLALAEAEGWLNKAGSKWKTMPEQMLMYRAAGFWSRVYAPELSLGMLTREEAEDVVSVPEKVPAVTSIDAEILGEIPAATAPQIETVKTQPELSAEEIDRLDMQAQDIVDAIKDATTSAALAKLEAEIKTMADSLGEKRMAVVNGCLAAAKSGFQKGGK